MPDVLRIADLTASEQIPDLHPHDYADLLARPTTSLDLLRLQLDIAAALGRITRRIEALEA